MNCNPITVYGQNKLYCENIGVALNNYGNELNQKIDFTMSQTQMSTQHLS